MGKQLRKIKTGQGRLTEGEIQKQLEAKLDELLHHRSAESWINPLLGLAGESCIKCHQRATNHV
jgi:hypothetical protein